MALLSAVVSDFSPRLGSSRSSGDGLELLTASSKDCFSFVFISLSSPISHFSVSFSRFKSPATQCQKVYYPHISQAIKCCGNRVAAARVFLASVLDRCVSDRNQLNA